MLLPGCRILFFIFIFFNVSHFLSITQSDSLIIKLSQTHDKKQKAEILCRLAGIEASKNVDLSNRYAKQALKEIEEDISEDASRLSAKLYRILGVNYFYNGHNDSSIIACEKALAISRKMNDNAGIAEAYNSMQTAYREIGNYSKAVEVSSQAQRYFEKDNNLKGQAKAILNIGILYGDQKLNKRSLEYLNKAKVLFFKLHDTAQWANAITRVGNVYMDNELHDSAKIMYLKALSLFQGINHKRGIAVIYNNLAGLTKVCTVEESLKYYEAALKVRMELGDKVSVCMIYGNIGSTYINKKNYIKALEYLDKSLTMAIEINSKENLPNLYKMIAGCYKKQGQTLKAFDALSKYAELKDSLFNKESIEKIEEIQTKYETEKKEQEIVLLNSTNALKGAEIRKNRAEISKQNQQKIIIGLILVFFILVSVVIFRSYRMAKRAKEIIEIQKKKIEVQKNIVDEKQKEIVDSINYAKRIQYSLLANESLLIDNLNDHFVLFKPKDIVSGDFYWATEHDNKFYIAVCDSTGHGVPGAFMSILNIGFLSEAIKEKEISKPNEVFDYVRNRLINSISRENQQDGMDGILLCIDKTTKQITYAAANNAPILISENKDGSELLECQKDRMPIGKGERTSPFNLFNVTAKEGDTVYLYTDGYADQFGGPKGKKFKYKPLNELLLTINHLSLNDQQHTLDETFKGWKGGLEQVDDVLIIGIRI